MDHLIASLYDVGSGSLFDFDTKGVLSSARLLSVGMEWEGDGHVATVWNRASLGDHMGVLAALQKEDPIDVGCLIDVALLKTHIRDAQILWNRRFSFKDGHHGFETAYIRRICLQKRAIETLTEVMAVHGEYMTRVRTIKLAAFATLGDEVAVESLLRGHVSTSCIGFGFALSMAIRHANEHVVRLLLDFRGEYDISSNFGMHLVEATTQESEFIFLAFLNDPDMNVAEYGPSAALAAMVNDKEEFLDKITSHPSWSHTWDSETEEFIRLGREVDRRTLQP